MVRYGICYTDSSEKKPRKTESQRVDIIQQHPPRQCESELSLILVGIELSLHFAILEPDCTVAIAVV